MKSYENTYDLLVVDDVNALIVPGIDNLGAHRQLSMSKIKVLLELFE